MSPPTRLQPFPITRWTLVARIGAPSDVTRQRALEDICQAYWYPLYAFARSKGFSPEDSEDHTQTFFARILQSDFFSQADAGRGKLRTFLLHAFTHHLINAHRDANRLKRGGGRQFVSIDLQAAEGRLLSEAAADCSVERHFEKRWAHALVESSTTQLEADYSNRGKAAHFKALKTFLEGANDDSSYAMAAAGLALSNNALRQEVSRMRKRFREIMRRAVADTLNDPTEAEVDAELAELKRVLRANPA